MMAARWRGERAPQLFLSASMLAFTSSSVRPGPPLVESPAGVLPPCPPLGPLDVVPLPELLGSMLRGAFGLAWLGAGLGLARTAAGFLLAGHFGQGVEIDEDAVLNALRRVAGVAVEGEALVGAGHAVADQVGVIPFA